jgi:hypothetical protein
MRRIKHIETFNSERAKRMVQTTRQMPKYLSQTLLSIFALICLLGIHPAFADWLQHTTDWQMSNLSMDVVPSEFNRCYGLVGMSVKEAATGILCNHFKFTRGKSDYIPMPVGPYDQTLLEVQYTDDQNRISRFRFVEKDGDGSKCGKYSTWQTEDIERKRNGGLMSSYANPNHLTLPDEKFDKVNWMLDLKSQHRLKETWDLLHSNLIIGMTRHDILDLLGPASARPKERDYSDPAFYQLEREYHDVDYYQLTSPGGDCVPSPIDYLELKYSNDHISAFRIEEITPILRGRTAGWPLRGSSEP